MIRATNVFFFGLLAAVVALVSFVYSGDSPLSSDIIERPPEKTKLPLHTPSVDTELDESTEDVVGVLELGL